MSWINKIRDGGVSKDVSDNKFKWIASWPLKHTTAKVDEGGRKARIIFKVTRNSNVLTVRVLIPLFVLVMISWCSFYLRGNHALMPRTIIGYVSFVALCSYSDAMASQIPKSKSEIAWIDTWISMIGFLMMFTVVENLVSEMIFFHISDVVSKEFDMFARIAFPWQTTFNVTLMVLGIGEDNILGINANMQFIIQHICLIFFL